MKDKGHISIPSITSLSIIYATVFSIGSFLRIPENLNADTIIISAICINFVLRIFVFKNTRINLIHADKTLFVKDFVKNFTSSLIFPLAVLTGLYLYLEKTGFYEIYDQPIPELFIMSWMAFMTSWGFIDLFFRSFMLIKAFIKINNY